MSGAEPEKKSQTGERRVTSPSEGPGGSLRREELDRLLERLASDREAAGEEYERIRGKLVRFLEWRGCHEAEDLADVALNRVARRLGDGVEIESDDPYVYFQGVAGRVYHEWLRERNRDRAARRGAARESETLRSSIFHEEEDTDPEVSELLEERLRCLRTCLARLSDDDRELVLGYYRGEGGARVRQRRLLARQQGLSMERLRLKAFRIRRRLERCIEDHLFLDDS